MDFDVVIVAAGKSERMTTNKMLLSIVGETTLERVLKAFLGVPNILRKIVIVNKDTDSLARELAAKYSNENILIVGGGKSREESVYNGLKYVKSEGVLVHDGARPFVSRDIINNVLKSVELYGSGVPVLRIQDSLRKIDGESIVAEANREKFAFVQTPQGFLSDDLKRAFQNVLAQKKKLSEYTDESEIYLENIGTPMIVEGDARNRKLTLLNDYYGLNSRVGTGFDIHKLVPGRKLMICGIEIEYYLGCYAHSDGDVGIHALIDALLSAIGELDIGSHFPDTDVKYDGIDSMLMLSEVMDKYKNMNAKIQNVSIVINIQEPRLADYIPIMKIKLSNALCIDTNRIAISAKTGEKIGDIGESKAVSAYATVLIN